MPSQQYTATTGRGSAALQSTPGKLRSIATSASHTSSEPSPKTSGSNPSIDNGTLTNVSTHGGGTKDPTETAPTVTEDSTVTEAAVPSMPYVWIALLVVGFIGTIVSTVVFVLAFLRIICAPKQPTGRDVISKELDKTLV
ncbi:hypothetical protein AAVH_11832 [Aphelenchoides avenae]|nr:hypothetical protein AAVH_11832 [Aphelenchus avenae]